VISDDALHVGCIEVFNQSSHKTHLMSRVLQQHLRTWMPTTETARCHDSWQVVHVHLRLCHILWRRKHLTAQTDYFISQCIVNQVYAVAINTTDVLQMQRARARRAAPGGLVQTPCLHLRYLWDLWRSSKIYRAQGRPICQACKFTSFNSTFGETKQFRAF